MRTKKTSLQTDRIDSVAVRGIECIRAVELTTTEKSMKREQIHFRCHGPNDNHNTHTQILVYEQKTGRSGVIWISNLVAGKKK